MFIEFWDDLVGMTSANTTFGFGYSIRQRSHFQVRQGIRLTTSMRAYPVWRSKQARVGRSCRIFFAARAAFRLRQRLKFSMYCILSIFMCIYIYIYTCVYIYIYIILYVHIYTVYMYIYIYNIDQLDQKPLLDSTCSMVCTLWRFKFLKSDCRLLARAHPCVVLLQVGFYLCVFVFLLWPMLQICKVLKPSSNTSEIQSLSVHTS